MLCEDPLGLLDALLEALLDSLFEPLLIDCDLFRLCTPMLWQARLGLLGALWDSLFEALLDVLPPCILLLFVWESLLSRLSLLSKMYPLV